MQRSAWQENLDLVSDLPQDVLDGPDVSLGDPPASIDVDVRDNLRLRIQAEPNTTEDFSGNIAWGDIRMVTADSCG